MLNFIAYGDELNLLHPPRPKDPKQVWEQIWAVKLRLKSTAMVMLADDEGGGRRGRAASRERSPSAAQQRGADAAPARPPQSPDMGSGPSQQREAEAAKPPSPGDAVQEGVKALRGLFKF